MALQTVQAQAQKQVFGALFTRDLVTVKTFPERYPGINRENMELLVKLMTKINKVKGIREVINVESKNYLGFVGDCILFLFGAQSTDYGSIAEIIDNVKAGVRQ
ncbi:MAG: hypothetical protein V1731_02705 [Candidatus Aenigmatarchaeota archaeon]